MQENVSHTKKERSSNFTTSEVDVLMKCVLQEIHIIENKKTDGITLKEKQEAWQRVSVLHNSANTGGNRNVSSIKMKYDNIKRNLKKKMAAIKMHQRGTGGGPPIDLKLQWYEEELYSLLKVNIEGLPVSCDSDAINQKKVYQIPEQSEDIFFVVETNSETEDHGADVNQEKPDDDDDDVCDLADINNTPSTSINSRVTTNRKWNLKKRNRVTFSRTEKQENIDKFINLAEKKAELVEIQKKCYLAELNEKQKNQDRQEYEWETRRQIVELELKIKKEEYVELLQENLRKKRIHELKKEKYKVELDILKCDLNKKLRNQN